MIMLHIDDQDDLRRMLGTEDIPEDFANEYMRLLTFRHRGLATGAIGVTAMAEMLCRLGYEAPSLKPERKQINWRGMSMDTRVLVRTDDGKLRPGLYSGLIDGTGVGVRFNGDSYVQEFPQSSVDEAGSDYPDIDMVCDIDETGDRFTRRDGTPY